MSKKEYANLILAINTLNDVIAGRLTQVEAAAAFKDHGMNDPWGIHKEAEALPFSPLVGQIFTKMISDSHDTSQRLIDNYRQQAEVAEATLDVIRTSITNLMTGRWTPNPNTVLNELWPHDEYVKQRIQEKKDVIS